jgi:predicted nucleotidyltransferase
MKLEEILKRKKNREKKLQEALETFLGTLRRWGALRVILFGSLARGTVDTWSDLDLLIVMPSSRSSKEWTDFIYRNGNLGVAADLIVYSEDDFVRMLPESAFLQEIVTSGKVLYEKESP